MTMRIGSLALLGGLALAVAGATGARALGAGAIGGGFGGGALSGGGVVAPQRGFIGRGFAGRAFHGRHRHYGWHGGWGRDWAYRHRGHAGRFGLGYGRYGYGLGYGGAPYAYGGSGGYAPYREEPLPQPVVGILPSPVLPPAIYVIDGSRSSAKARKGERRGVVATSSHAVAGTSGAVVTRITPNGHRLN